jgi:hypothetical protein
MKAVIAAIVELAVLTTHTTKKSCEKKDDISWLATFALASLAPFSLENGFFGGYDLQFFCPSKYFLLSV